MTHTLGAKFTMSLSGSEECTTLRPGLALSFQNDSRYLPIAAKGQVLHGVRPAPCWLLPLTFVFSSKLLPRGGCRCKCSRLSCHGEWKKGPTVDLSPSSSFSSSLPKSTLPLELSPSWLHNSRCRRRPLFQDLPKYPQNASPHTPMLPTRQHWAPTSLMCCSSSKGKGQPQGGQSPPTFHAPPRGELAIMETQGMATASVFNKAELLLKRKSFYGPSRPGLETLATQYYRPTLPA